MSFLKNLKLIEQIIEDKFNDFDIFHFASFFNQFLNSSKKTFLLMLSYGDRKVIFDIFQLPIQYFQLIKVLKGIRKRK